MAGRGGVIGLVVEPETVKQGLVWGRWVHPAAPTRARILLVRPRLVQFGRHRQRCGQDSGQPGYVDKLQSWLTQSSGWEWSWIGAGSLILVVVEYLVDASKRIQFLRSSSSYLRGR